MRVIAALAVALAVAAMSSSTVAAQTHPCDQPPLANQTIAAGAPHRAQFCAPAAARVEAAVGKVAGKLKSLSAGKMGYSTTEVGDLVAKQL